MKKINICAGIIFLAWSVIWLIGYFDTTSAVNLIGFFVFGTLGIVSILMGLVKDSK